MLAFARFKQASFPRGSALTLIRVELLTLLLVAVALTIMPEMVLGALAEASSWAHDLALTYRPVVAFAGLLLVGAIAWALLALRSATTEVTPQKTEGEKRTTLFRAA